MQNELKNILRPFQSQLARVQKTMQQSIQGLSMRVDSKGDEGLLRMSGKQIRALLLLWTSCKSGKRINKSAIQAAAAVELLHQASLVHDDILDHALTRRGKKTLHTVWGSQKALLFGDMLLAHSFSRVAGLENPALMQHLGSAAVSICEGEILQNSYAFKLDMDESIYWEIIQKKTASLFAHATAMGGCLAEFQKPVIKRLFRFGESLGIAFQILDDCLDLTLAPEKSGKDSFRDLAEGKLTLPVYVLMRRLPVKQRKKLMPELFKNSRTGHKQIREALETVPAITESLQYVAKYLKKARRELRSVPDLQYRESLNRLTCVLETLVY